MISPSISESAHKNSNMLLSVYITGQIQVHTQLQISRLEYVVGCKRVGSSDLQNNSEG